MTTVKEIEKAIAELPAEKISILRSWFDKFEATRWDNQIEKDVKVGKLDRMAAKVVANFKKGKCKAI